MQWINRFLRVNEEENKIAILYLMMISAICLNQFKFTKILNNQSKIYKYQVLRNYGTQAVNLFEFEFEFDMRQLHRITLICNI